MELYKMSTISHHHQQIGDKMRDLYEASSRGCVSTLNSLMHQHPHILYRISQTSFTETPLHISSSLGHFDFTKILLTHNPKLALELDFSRRTPLHMASAEGHIEIVKELVQVYKEACLFCDEEGRIPLHYAAMRGRREVAKELIRAKPESLKILDKGKNVLHLCVMYNHLETLKALVELEIDTTELLIHTDHMDGNNNILHLAVILKLVQIVGYLLSIPKITEAANMKNGMGFTAYDILHHSPKDLKTFEIQLLFMDNGIQTEKREMNYSTPPQPTPPLPTTTTNNNNGYYYWRRILRSIDNSLNNKGDWVEETRGTLSLVATVISTITFQAGINTPGGFIQQGITSLTPNNNNMLSNSQNNNNDPLGCYMRPHYSTPACPGHALVAIRSPTWFHYYVFCNTICFCASLSVTLLLVSGVPVKNRAVMWVLSIGMCVTLTFLGLTYSFGISMIFPGLWESTCSSMVSRVSNYAWYVLLGLIGLFFMMRLGIWIVKMCMNKINLHI